MNRRKVLASAVAGVIVACGVALAQGVPPDKFPETYLNKIPMMSGYPSLHLAELTGMTEMMGKPLGLPPGPPGSAKTKKLTDVPIGTDPNAYENEPTVAANPVDKKKLVAGSHYYPDPQTGSNRCVAYYSHDRGKTWSAPIFMPHLAQNISNQCSDPVLAYAPDGSRVYYSYMDITGEVVGGLFINDLNIVVSYSDDDGMTWSGPIVALDGLESILDLSTGVWTQLGFDYDKNWVGTHIDIGESGWVYVTATRFDNFAPGDCHIAFTASSDMGLNWSTPFQVDSGAGCDPVVQGSRPVGGLGGEVLVAWFNSSDDGWLSGGFEIRTRRSGDWGATWDPIVTAVSDSYELPFWLGPFAFYHRWWGGMFPDVEIDAGGGAHLMYAHDPVEGPETPEEGDIRYLASDGPPYVAWSYPVTVNDDGMERAQGYAAMETQHGGQSATVHAIWEDHRLGPELPIVGFPFNESPNLYFDMFYSRLVPGQGTEWFRNFRVSDASSLVDWVFIGDYNDLTTNNKVFGIWTDRRDKDLPNDADAGTGIFDFEDDVFGGEIISGGGTPK